MTMATAWSPRMSWRSTSTPTCAKDTGGRQNPTSEARQLRSQNAAGLRARQRQARRPAAAQVRHPGHRIQYGWRGSLRGWQIAGRRRQGQAPAFAGHASRHAHRFRASKWATSRTARATRWFTPATTRTVSIKIQFVRRRPKAALDDLDNGLEYYNKGNADNYKKAAESFRKGPGRRPHLQPGRTLPGPHLQRPVRRGQGRAIFSQGASQSTPIMWRPTPASPACCWITATWTRLSAS